MEEQLNVSPQYKKAYNHADILCRFAPELLKDMKMPEDPSGEYKKGFMSRIDLFEKERSVKKFDVNKIHEKYGNPDKDGQDRSIEPEKE